MTAERAITIASQAGNGEALIAEAYLLYVLAGGAVKETRKMKCVLKKKPDIMITHVAHEIMNTNPVYRGSECSQYFFYLDKDFDFSGVKYLINGHVHHADVQHLGDTTVMCNPFGYLGECDPLSVHGMNVSDFLFEL